MDTPDKIQFHPGFYGAAELEFRLETAEIEFNIEYNLSKGAGGDEGTSEKPSFYGENNSDQLSYSLRTFRNMYEYWHNESWTAYHCGAHRGNYGTALGWKTDSYTDCDRAGDGSADITGTC